MKLKTTSSQKNIVTRVFSYEIEEAEDAGFTED